MLLPPDLLYGEPSVPPSTKIRLRSALPAVCAALLAFACTAPEATERKGDPGRADTATVPDTGTSEDRDTADTADTDPLPDTDTDTDDLPPPDECDGVDDPTSPASCPDPGAMSLAEGGGLAPVDADGFVLADEDGWADADAILTALERTLDVRTVGDVLASANRDGELLSGSRAAGFASGFEWNAGDEDVTYWIPQGVTGSFDADSSGRVDGYSALLVSWHYDPEEGGTDYDKGVRVSFVDVSSPSVVSYRHVLLVEPTGTPDAPDFAAVPVHAGGMAWVGSLLYVADTGHGLRVFDLSRILEVSTDVDDIGCDSSGHCTAWDYRYVLPQVSRYVLPECGCDATFSFVSVDSSTTPPSLVTGAYDADTIEGLLVRWPLDATTHLLAGGAYTRATQAFVAQQDRIQGAASRDGDWWLSCSSQSGAYGLLYATASGVPSTAHSWVDGPEDLAIDPGNNWLWSASEDVGDRAVFAVELAEVR
ncbi:MAG: hypothetical protein Q8P18_27900 [Pseudomonadota bacterium]|nr:hypothetical protein [Pseudomonadota bacterium]